MLTFLLSFALAADPKLESDATALVRNASELSAALDSVKQPLPEAVRKVISAGKASDVEAALEPHVFLATTINPEGRVKIARGAADAALTKGQPQYVIVKVENQSGGQQKLTAHGTYAGSAESPFDVRFETVGKVTPELVGHFTEYRLLRITCSKAGKRELTIGFDAGQGTQDLGFRGVVPVLFEVKQ